jgi:hypothetical protein
LSTGTAWEAGLTCDADDCGGEFGIGEDFLWFYGQKLHARCASAAAAGRREASGEDGNVLEAAARILACGERVILTRRQLRGLIAEAAAWDVVPVRKPDQGRHQWYGRMPGWSAARVQAGLTAGEVTGMWSDFLDVGRIPPLRARDLAVVMAAIGGPGRLLAAAGAPQKGQEPRDGGSP